MLSGINIAEVEETTAEQLQTQQMAMKYISTWSETRTDLKQDRQYTDNETLRRIRVENSKH